jgi:hypothetical protein
MPYEPLKRKNQDLLEYEGYLIQFETGCQVSRMLKTTLVKIP